MSVNYFKVLRGGTHTTFQDKGFLNKQHLGITTGGAVDYELFTLSNKLLENPIDTPVIEFSFQGPCLKLKEGKCRFVITGNVSFDIISNKKKIEGNINESYILQKDEILDIKSTIKSNYGYLSIEGGFKIEGEFESFSTLTISKIGSNEGIKISDNQKIFLKRNGSSKKTKLDIKNKLENNFIRVLAGPQMNYFFPKIIKKFFNQSFKISKTSNRMGIRLEKNICKPVKSYNIPSEGIIKGSIQVPGDGNPIVLMNDHPTIGGYPKIAIVILADFSKIAQFSVGTQFKFILVSLKEAENLYKKYIEEINNKLLDIKFN